MIRAPRESCCCSRLRDPFALPVPGGCGLKSWRSIRKRRLRSRPCGFVTCGPMPVFYGFLAHLMTLVLRTSGTQIRPLESGTQLISRGAGKARSGTLGSSTHRVRPSPIFRGRGATQSSARASAFKPLSKNYKRHPTVRARRNKVPRDLLRVARWDGIRSLEDSAAQLPLCFHKLTPLHRTSIAVIREGNGTLAAAKGRSC